MIQMHSEDKIKVIKISKQAIFEFIYEKIIESQEAYFDVDATEVMDTFDIDWETGEFIFCVHQCKDENGDIVPFPKEIDLRQLMKKLPDTTLSMFSGDCYQEYSADQLQRYMREENK